jgi:hypothetical protein
VIQVAVLAKDKFRLFDGNNVIIDERYQSGAPAVTDDSAHGFGRGSKIITATATYTCCDPAVGAAVWVANAKINFLGVWVSATTVGAVNDIITYKGNTYICILAVGATATLPSADPTHWTLITDHISGVVADPGNAGAIAVTKSGSCPLVSGGAETRTLAIPSYVGQQLALNMKTDGGDITLTVASAFNQAGNNTIVFNDVGDTVHLRAIDKSGTLCWRLTSNDGAALSTV